jgi:hypothetical protein
MPAFFPQSLTTCHTTRSVTPSPQAVPAMQTHRNPQPSFTPANKGQESRGRS